jgi:hypothetical protein
MKRSIMFLVLVLWSASYSSGQQQKPLNIAVIADKAGSLAQSPLISLLEVRLSQNENVKLLERAQIDKIMQEQQLIAAGFLDRNNTIKIGQLLRADAFIIITSEGDLIRVRVAETAHGLRLFDRFEELDRSKLEEISTRIAGDIKNVLGKLSLPAGELIPVGIVDIHRVQLGEQHRILERTLPVLLSVRLGIEPKIIMLEREDLKVLLDEKLRTQGEDSKFWSSAVLIEGNLQPKNSVLEMSLSLRRPAGEATKSFTVPVEPNEPLSAIDKAATDIVQEILNTPPSSQWQLAQEAEQFYQQGQLLAAHSRFDDAFALYETAHALQPQNVYYTGALFERIWEIRNKIEMVVRRNEIQLRIREEWQKNNPQRTIAPLKLEEPGVCPYSDLELAELVSVFVHQLHDRIEKGQLSASDIKLDWSIHLGTGNVQIEVAYFLSHNSVTTKQVRLINMESRKIWIEIMDEALKHQTLRVLDQQMNIPRRRAELVWLSTDDPNELIANIKKAFAELIMPPEKGGKIQSNSFRESICKTLFSIIGESPSSIATDSHNLERTHLRGSSEMFIKLWQEYLEELTDVNDPVLSVTSKLALARVLTGSSDQAEKTQLLSAGYETIEAMLKELKNFDKSKSNQAKQQLLTQIKSAIKAMRMNISVNDEIATWEQMCTLLIEQNDITNLAFLNPGLEPFITGPRLPVVNEQELYQRYYLLLDRITEILQTHKGDILVNVAMSNIKDFQTEIKQKFPELEVPQKKQNLPITMLLTLKDWFKDIENSRGNRQIRLTHEIVWSDRSFQIKLQDEILWVSLQSGGSTGNGNRDNQGNLQFPVTIGFVGINLAQKEVAALWQAEIISPNAVREITDLSVTNEVSYISLQNAGILEFPGRTSKRREMLTNPKLLTQENGLPSLSITSIAQDGDKLLVAYGASGQESGLGLYDIKAEKWETIFCSTLKGESLFSKGKPYVIYSMQLLSPEELFFLVYDPTISRDKSQENPAGLWRMNTVNREMKYLGPLWVDQQQRVNVAYFEQKLWFKSWNFIIKFDPDSEKLTKIMGDTSLVRNRYLQKNISLSLNRDVFIPESSMNDIKFGYYRSYGACDLSTGAIYKNKLWARLGQSQIIIFEKGKSFQDAQIIDNNILDGGPVSRFVSTSYGLIAIGEGTVGLIETP